MLTSSHTIRNMGVIFDLSLTFQSHISSITKAAFYYLSNIARLRPTLSIKDTETLIHALRTSFLDYCNLLLIGLPVKTITRLQYVQNSAVTVISQVKKSEHIIPLVACFCSRSV